MKLLFIGDVVGSRGRDMSKIFPKLKENIVRKLRLLMVKMLQVVRGITEKIYQEFLEWGVQLYNGKSYLG